MNPVFTIDNINEAIFNDTPSTDDILFDDDMLAATLSIPSIPLLRTLCSND